jgi:hypothetical protein
MSRLAISTETGRWGPPGNFFFYFSGIFSFRTLPSVGHSVNALPSTRQKILGKDGFADFFFAMWAYTWQSFCRVPQSLSKTPVSSSVGFHLLRA